MSWTEALGFALALVMVVCSIRELHWSWPLAIASSVLYFFVFRDSLLYAEASLQIVFAVLAFMLVYGGTIIILTMLLTASGLDLITSASAIVACAIGCTRSAPSARMRSTRTGSATSSA